jgi:hypothetical protein
MKGKSMKAILPIYLTNETAKLARVGLLIVTAASVLTGCSGGVSKSQIAAAINEEIKEKLSFGLENKRMPTWPLRVERPLGLMSEKPLDPILAAMQAAGYLKITQERQQQGFGVVIIDVITPTEKAKGWWDVQNGFCVGTKAVAEVQQWTEPGKQSGMAIQVNYTWRLTDVPSWARGAEFKNIEGMTIPVAGMTVLQKTNKGWKSALKD